MEGKKERRKNKKVRKERNIKKGGRREREKVRNEVRKGK